ncbi:MAG: amidohydrolase family protein [Armatimonadia bacterium]
MSESYFIDTHVHVRDHISPERLSGGTYPSPERAMEILKPLGIKRAVILPGVHGDGVHDIQGNGEILTICERYPDFFIPFMNLAPSQLQNLPTTDLGHLMRFYKAHGCKGIGEMSCNIPFDDPMLMNLFHHAEENELPLLFHIGHQRGGCYGLIDRLGLPLLEQALKSFPSLKFIGHSQPFWAEISGDVTEELRRGYPTGPVAPGGRLVHLFRTYPNLYADLSPATGGSGFNAIRRDPEFGYAFMEEFQDRLLFATDLAGPSIDMKLVPYLAEAAKQGKISQTAFEKMAHRNAEKLLGL